MTAHDHSPRMNLSQAAPAVHQALRALDGASRAGGSRPSPSW